MAPFCCQPAVIVVQPSNHRTYIEGAVYGVKNIGRTGYSSTVWDDGTLNNGPKELGAFFEPESFETAADGVEEDVTCGLVLLKAKSQ